MAADIYTCWPPQRAAGHCVARAAPSLQRCVPLRGRGDAVGGRRAAGRGRGAAGAAATAHGARRPGTKIGPRPRKWRLALGAAAARSAREAPARRAGGRFGVARAARCEACRALPCGSLRQRAGLQLGFLRGVGASCALLCAPCRPWGADPSQVALVRGGGDPGEARAVDGAACGARTPQRKERPFHELFIAVAAREGRSFPLPPRTPRGGVWGGLERPRMARVGRIWAGRALQRPGELMALALRRHPRTAKQTTCFVEGEQARRGDPR